MDSQDITGCDTPRPVNIRAIRSERREPLCSAPAKIPLARGAAGIAHEQAPILSIDCQLAGRVWIGRKKQNMHGTPKVPLPAHGQATADIDIMQCDLTRPFLDQEVNLVSTGGEPQYLGSGRLVRGTPPRNPCLGRAK
jgi:hypothetical protein